MLFAGDSDLEVLSQIFTCMGSIDENDWPEVLEMPCYLPFAEMDSTGIPKVEDETV